MDKMFLMIPEFTKVSEYDIKAAWDAFYQENPEITAIIRESQWAAFEKSYAALLKSNPEEAESIDVNSEEWLNWFVQESGLKQYEWADGVQKAFSEWFVGNTKARFFKKTKITKVDYDYTKPAHEQKKGRQARNNALIDIAYGILTNPDTAEKIHNPGSFDKAKIAARIATIISDPTLLDNFAGEQGLMHQIGDNDYEYDPKEVTQLLLEMSKERKLDELDEFIKRYKVERSQLTVDTFIYNHRQNMTGGALIGMYANNTTMQAKLQVSDLAIKEQNVFTINGRIVQSLHDITSPLGERISKNCANFSAASVDNVKDPVLADLMQNTKTANITGFMLRAGMNIEEIGLLFSQPIIRETIIKDNSLENLEDAIDEELKEFKKNGGGVDLNILKHDFTSEELLNNIISEHILSELSNEDALAVKASQIQAALLMLHISNMATELSALTRIARADSPNGAIDISIAGAKTQVREVTMFNRKAKDGRFHLSGANILRNKYVNPNMSIDQLRAAFLKSKTPMLQAFYSLGIEMGADVMSQYFSQTTPYSNVMVDKIFDNSKNGVVKPKMLNKYYNELVEFALSKTKIFGDDGTLTFDEKRDYYLYDFPSDFMAMLADNPDIANMGIIRKMHITKDNIELRKSGRLSTSMKETLMRDFDRLLDMENPIAQRVAIDLFMYSYYKDGFKFGPNSFGTFFSTTFIAAFPEVVNTLRTMRYEMKEGSYFDKFLPQFYANHCFEGLVPRVGDGPEIIKSNDGRIVVPAKYVLNRNLITEGKIGSFPYITFSAAGAEGFYSLVSESKERAIYQPAVFFTTEQKGLRGVRYNANMTAQEMSSIVPKAPKVATAIKSTTQSYTFYNDDESSYDDLSTNIKEFMDLDDATLDSLDRDIESYNTEDYDESVGEATLDTPLCK